MFCIICTKLTVSRQSACPDCQKELLSVSLTPEAKDQIYLFRYAAPIQKVVLNAKISGNLSSILFLTEQLLLHKAVQSSLAWADAIVPAPSSLWGRLHGKTDLAYLTAHTLAHEAQIKLLKPPRTLGWHYKKQSMRPMRHLKQRSVRQQDQPNKQANSTKVILLDDITTSGETLRSLQDSMGITNCVKICIAKAPSAS